MSPIDAFQPPTDSVYKFMALTGVILFGVFLVFYWRVFELFSGKLFAAKIRGRVLQRKTELMRTFLEKVNAADPDPIRGRDEVIALACAQEEHDVLTEEAEEFFRRWRAMRIALPLLLAGSGYLAYQGFSLWYQRVQIHQDRLLVLEVQKNEPGKPIQVSEPTGVSVTPTAGAPVEPPPTVANR